MIDTPWGHLSVETGERGLRAVIFDGPAYPPLTGDWALALAGYMAGVPIPLELPVDLSDLPPFTRRVLEACRRIPFGATVTYVMLAAEVGAPRAARAVGQAMARNPVPVVIPCHRVLGADGSLTGFTAGLAWKRNLLQHEAALQH